MSDNVGTRGPNYNWEIEANSLRKDLEDSRKLVDQLDRSNERLHETLEYAAVKIWAVYRDLEKNEEHRTKGLHFTI